MSNKNKANAIKSTDTVSTRRPEAVYTVCIFIFLAALIFYPPYVRGLFFPEDMFLYHIFTAITFLLVFIDKMIRQDYELFSTPLDWAVAAYAAAYLLSLIGAVAPGETVYGFLKALNYFMVYWMVSQVVRSYWLYERLMQVLIASGVGVAIVGILAATGYSHYNSAFDGQIITSTLQYKNATAIFLIVTTMLAVALWAKEKNKIVRLLYAVANYLMILVIIGTMSKGGWLVLGLGAVVLIAGMPKGFRLKTLYAWVMGGLAAAAASVKFLPAVTAGPDAHHALVYIALGLALAIGGEALWHLIMYARQRWSKTVVISGILLLIVIVAGIGLAASGANIGSKLQSGIVVEQAQRLTDFSDFSYVNRADMYKWGWAMAKDHLLIGAGGEGWQALYHQYQDYLWYSEEVHNHYLKVLIETGLVGLLSFLAMFGLVIWAVIKRGKGLKTADSEAISEKWILNWAAAAAALMIGVHAFIDFDLSLGAVSILLWTLFALVNAGSRMDNLFQAPLQNKWLFTAVCVIMVAVLMINGLRMNSASHLYIKASALWTQATAAQDAGRKEELLGQVTTMMDKASRNDPYNVYYPAMLAQTAASRYQLLSQQKENGGQEALQTVHTALQAAEKLKPYDEEVRNALFTACMLIGDNSGALEQAQLQLEMNPLEASAYSAVIQLSAACGEQSYDNNDQKAAAEYFGNAIQYAEKMEQQKSKLDPKKMQEPFWGGPPYVLSDEAKLNLGESYYLMGDYASAQKILKPFVGAKIDTNFPVAVWYFAAMYKNGDIDENQAKSLALAVGGSDEAKLFNTLMNIKTLGR